MIYIYVDTIYATFAIGVVDNRVVTAPPIARWMVNMLVSDVKSYLHMKGILHRWIHLNVNEGKEEAR